MLVVFLLQIIAALCILPSLIYGAISDYKTRTFPKKYWNYTLKAAGVAVFIQYLTMLAFGDYATLGYYLIISILGFLFCWFMGLRYGSGGDWRALGYIALISPAILANTAILSLLAGAALAVYVMGAEKSDVPHAFRTVPFAVAILVGYAATLLLMVVL